MPQRFLRPGIRTSSRWNAVSHRAARLYIAILTLVDDFGRYDGRDSVLWADAFSVWNDQHPEEQVSRQETAADCQQLAAEKLVEFYECDGKKFLQVSQWQERARNKSRFPHPSDSKRLPLAAETCRNLPPSPSPSPSPDPIDHRHTAAENGNISATELQTLLNQRFSRLDGQRWTCEEERCLCEVARRHESRQEFDTIFKFKDGLPEADRKYFPNSVLSLLTKWSDTLDRARATQQTKSFPPLDPEKYSVTMINGKRVVKDKIRGHVIEGM